MAAQQVECLEYSDDDLFPTPFEDDIISTFTASLDSLVPAGVDDLLDDDTIDVNDLMTMFSTIGYDDVDVTTASLIDNTEMVSGSELTAPDNDADDALSNTADTPDSRYDVLVSGIDLKCL